LPNYLMPAPLIVRRRSEVSRWSRFEIDPFEKPIKGEIEIQTRLLAVSDDIQTRRYLIAHRRSDGIVLKFTYIVCPKLIEMFRSKLQPPRKRIAAYNGRA